jgi:hypothetical protein
LPEEVARVDPALVLPDKEGKPYTVRYDAVNAMLLNEFLKEHRKMEQQDRTLNEQATIAQLKKELQTTTARQQKQIEALTAGLQKVSTQKRVNLRRKWSATISKLPTGERSGLRTRTATTESVLLCARMTS